MRRFRTIQMCGFGFALLLLAVYSLEFVPGVMNANGKMFGLFSMTTFVDIGHLGLGAIALVCALIGPRAARASFWFLGFFYAADVITYFLTHLHTLPLVRDVLVNGPHAAISLAAFLIAMHVGKRNAYVPSNAIAA